MIFTPSPLFAVNPSGPGSVIGFWHICSDSTGMSGNAPFIDALDQQLLLQGWGRLVVFRFGHLRGLQNLAI